MVLATYLWRKIQLKIDFPVWCRGLARMDRCLNHVETMKIVSSNQMNHRLNRCPSSFFHGLTWFDTIKMLVEIVLPSRPWLPGLLPNEVLSQAHVPGIEGSPEGSGGSEIQRVFSVRIFWTYTHEEVRHTRPSQRNVWSGLLEKDSGLKTSHHIVLGYVWGAQIQ